MMTLFDSLFTDPAKPSGPVECLGQTFPSEQARREHFLTLLADKLKDPIFRKIEGFPKGTDEAILAMSDPPYYTACPYPWLVDFVNHYGKPYDPNVKYSREPQTIDVSVGKTDALYKAHSIIRRCLIWLLYRLFCTTQSQAILCLTALVALA